MEFHEKLQELRKSRGLTQEELAEALFVSRTAISKWESGRGYPSIDSLKEISRYFSVSIDDLLSGDQLIFIAEKENKSNLNGLCDLLLGFVDLLSLMLIFTMAVVGTIAYLSTSSDPVTNTFVSSTVTTSVDETIDKDVKRKKSPFNKLCWYN